MVMNNYLLVIGAGPKALAIHAKARVLHDMGRRAPHVIIIEKSHIGANWSGDAGYTDGLQEVVTPADNDLGFPYGSRSSFGLEVEQAMAKYSWHAFQIAQRRLAKWIIGGRKNIAHADLASYLCWVAKCTYPDIRFGEVIANGIRCNGKEWIVQYLPKGEKRLETLRGSGLVVTGPGEPRKLAGHQVPHSDVSNSRSFWERGVQKNLADVTDGHIAVVGAGDTAASAVVTLLRKLPQTNGVTIHLFCGSSDPLARLRHESTDHLYAYPGDWPAWPAASRMKFLNSTQRGVFSTPLMDEIHKAKEKGVVVYKHGFVWRADLAEDAEKPLIELRLTRGDRRKKLYLEPVRTKFRRVVVAIGFKRYSFEDWFEGGEVFGPRRFKDVAEEEEVRKGEFDGWKEQFIARKIQQDLSYWNPEKKWPNAKLYLPSLAGFSCGPGFPTLGCLGDLSDRVIASHLDFVGS